MDGQTQSMPEHNSGISYIDHAPAVDSIEEFKVQTSFFSAEFGNTGGAVVNIITKSGTNQYHGSGYWYHRDSIFDANSFFSNRAGAARPKSKRDLYGGTIGGPVIKNKTFAFFSFERLPENPVRNTLATFPTAQERQGGFSDQFLNGVPITIYNPFDTYTNAAGVVKRRPFANNVVPSLLWDPIAVKAASYWPETNQPGTTNNWYNSSLEDNANNQMEVKIDHNFGEKDRVTGRWSWRRAHYIAPAVFGEGKPGIPWEYGKTFMGARNIG